MKTRLLIAALLLTAFGTARAQENENQNATSVVVMTTGDVTLRQGSPLLVQKNGNNGSYTIQDDKVTLSGTADFEVTVPELGSLSVSSTGDVLSQGALVGDKLVITSMGTGDINLDIDYQTVDARLSGTGDVTLRGKCQSLVPQVMGHGELDVNGLKYEEGGNPKKRGENSDMASLSELMSELGKNMDYLQDSVYWEDLEQALQRLSDSVDWEKFERDMEQWGKEMEKWGRKMEKWGERFEDRHGRNYDYHYDYHYEYPNPKNDEPNDKRPAKKSLLFDAHWNGFEAGLNMLLGPGSTANFEGEYAYLEQRPLKSWVFNFNIADVGIAFNRRHTAGLYTGIGLGWNNYSFNNPIRLIKGEDHLQGEWFDPEEVAVKRSKLGVLYVQAPLMIEVRPTHRFYIAAGVTGGLRVDTWSKIKFENGDVNKVHSDYYVNPLKLDATLRMGGDDLGFFADFNLLSTFDEAHGPTSHTMSFGFSVNF